MCYSRAVSHNDQSHERGETAPVCVHTLHRCAGCCTFRCLLLSAVSRWVISKLCCVLSPTCLLSHTVLSLNCAVSHSTVLDPAVSHRPDSLSAVSDLGETPERFRTVMQAPAASATSPSPPHSSSAMLSAKRAAASARATYEAADSSSAPTRTWNEILCHSDQSAAMTPPMTPPTTPLMTPMTTTPMTPPARRRGQSPSSSIADASGNSPGLVIGGTWSSPSVHQSLMGAMSGHTVHQSPHRSTVSSPSQSPYMPTGMGTSPAAYTVREATHIDYENTPSTVSPGAGKHDLQFLRNRLPKSSSSSTEQRLTSLTHLNDTAAATSEQNNQRPVSARLYDVLIEREAARHSTRQDAGAGFQLQELIKGSVGLSQGRGTPHTTESSFKVSLCILLPM